MTKAKAEEISSEGEDNPVIEPVSYGTLHEEGVLIREPRLFTEKTIKYRKNFDISRGGLGVLEASFSYIKGSLSSHVSTRPNRS